MGVNNKSVSTFVRTGVAIFIAALCFAIPVKGQIYVGGELAGNETYSPENNPYIVTQDLIVGMDVTLTILPGVEMLFEYGTSLINNGTLLAKGTPEQKILFFPKTLVTLPGQWNGILFNSSKTILDADSNYVSGSVLSDAVISNASYAVTLDYKSTVLIENTGFTASSFGILMNESGHNTIRNCFFKNCDFGIFLASGFHNTENKIYKNTFSECIDAGIFINSTSSLSNHNLINDNHINSCSVGIHLGNYGNNGPGYNLVSGNVFNGNKDAIKLFQESNTIRNNFFMLNRSGIICWQSDNNLITRNLFSRNVLNAVTLSCGSSYNNISYNSMNFNSGGVWIKPDSMQNSLSNTFLYNTLYKNTDFSFQIINTPQGPVQFNNLMLNGDFQSFKNLADSAVHAEYNYWGTTSVPGIDSLIFDVYDDQLHGEVLYNPILDNILSIAPVPPPGNVIKQLIDNEVVVSWDEVPVTDINAYNVYYGTNDAINYEHTLNNGMKTRVNLGNYPIGDTIAITAVDFQAGGLNDQTEGHESDFSFAIPAPYAGPDTAICFNSTYAISKASAYSYEILNWSGSGDGLFDNTHILNPVYSPGPQDYAKGSVTLYLNAENGELQYKDDALITFDEAPLVNAGNDTLISMDSTLWLINASASGYDFVKWSTSGDGIFNSDSLKNPVYKPGLLDIDTREVLLTCTAYSTCGSATDQLKLNLDSGYRIEGRIHAGEILASNSTINLYQVKGDKVQPLRSGMLAVDGTFKLKSLLSGAYYLYVIPDKTTAPGYFPTYFFNDIRWENAYLLELDADTYDVDIDLTRSPVHLPLGEGSISGYCGTASGNYGDCGEVSVLLYDRKLKNILDWSMVSQNSDFRFKNLPYGEYVLAGEKAGVQAFYSDVILITPSQPKAENVELICTSAGYKFSTPGSLKSPPGTSMVNIYPNPVVDRLYISGLISNRKHFISIVNSQGIVQKYYPEPDGTGNYSIFLGTLPSGFYMIEVFEDGNCLVKQKFVK